MSHAICITEKMNGTYNAVDLVNVIYAPGGTATVIDNGNVVLLDARVSGERDVVYGITPSVNSAKANIVLVCSPDVQYDERLVNDAENFYNLAGDVVRGYRLGGAGQYFAVTADALTGTSIVVGDVIELAAATKLKAVASLTSGSTKIGDVVDVFALRGKTYYSIMTV
jgi:hypothetical protein